MKQDDVVAMDALPNAQPAVSKHGRHEAATLLAYFIQPSQFSTVIPGLATSPKITPSPPVDII